MGAPAFVERGADPTGLGSVAGPRPSVSHITVPQHTRVAGVGAPAFVERGTRRVTGVSYDNAVCRRGGSPGLR